MKISTVIFREKKFRKDLFNILLSMVCFTLIPLIFFFFTIDIQSKILHIFKDLFLKKELKENLIILVFKFIGSLFLMQTLHLIGGTFLGRALSNINKNLKLIMFEKFQKLPLSFSEKNNAGSSEKYITQSAENFVDLVYFFFANVFPSLMSIFVCIFQSFLFSSYFGSSKVLWFLGILLFGVVFAQLPINSNKVLFRKRKEQSGFLVDLIKNTKIDKIFQSQHFNRKIFEFHVEEEEKTYFNSIFLNGLSKFFIGNLNGIICGIFIIFIKFYSNAFLNVFDSDQSYHILSQILCFLKDIWSTISSILPLSIMMGKIRGSEKFLLEQEENLRSNKITLNEIKTIEIKNLNFSYEKTREIFNNFSCKFEPGLTILNGPSGSGKSTLIKILLGLEDTESKSIFYNKIDIKEYQKPSIVSKASYLTQSEEFFNNSIEFNLKIANPDISEKDLEEILSIAHVKEFLGKNNENYKKIVGVNCSYLSGGQAKRLAIARMLLKDRKNNNLNLVILDEPFTHLDNHLVKEIQKIVEKFIEQKRIIIAIDHTKNLHKIANEVIDLK